jgi:lysozyme
MKTSAKGIKLIKEWEGFSAVIYKCPAGKNTIGYGHVVRRGETFVQPMTKKQATDLLRIDLVEREDKLCKLLKVLLNQNQFDALISFAYNVGLSAFKSSTLLKKINQNDHSAACDEFGRWVNIKGVRSEGLVRRRRSESLLYATPL